MSKTPVCRLVVERFVWKTTKGKYFQCLCECGERSIVRQDHLKSGRTRSCGCLQKELASTHGLRGTTEYGIWAGMKNRCYNKKVPAYKDYGGRGIKICQRWRDSFSAFFEDMGERPKGKDSIDRKDNDGNYEPSNCRWATWTEQSRNRPSYNRIIEFNGKKQCLAVWAEELGMKWQTLFARLRLGWSIERALTEKVRLIKRKGK